MLYEVKKLFNGFASIRDYLVDKCVKCGEDLTIKYKDEIMIVPLGKLKSPERFQIHKTKFKSRYNDGKDYELYDFYWKPDANRQASIDDFIGNMDIK